MNGFYVYTYIDPRNLEEFYYGKGKGTRKNAHLADVSDTEKSRRIRDIRKAGLEPVVRVIASNLTEHEALLVEATLIWKLGKFTTNIAEGHFAEKFRPHNTYHLELPDFDFQNGILYYNVGEGRHRNWDDYVKYGFISAGQGERWRDGILRLREGDVVVARLRSRGYVGVGKVRQSARRVRDVEIRGKRLLDLELKSKHMGENSNSVTESEYVALVKWVKTVPRSEAKWKPKSGLFSSQHITASLQNQPKTIAFVEKEFGVDLRSLVV